MAEGINLGHRSVAGDSVCSRQRVRRFSAAFFLIALLLATVSCRKTQSAAADGGAQPSVLSVVASIRPYALLAQEIGGEKISVDLLMKGGASPHLYAPKMSDLLFLEKADVFILNGAGLEGTLETILPSLKNTLTVADLAQTKKAAETAAFNPHFWFSVPAMKAVALSLAETLALLDSDSADFYRANAAAFAARLDSTASALCEQRRAFPENFVYLTMHDSYAYLNQLLEIEALPVEASPGRELSAKAAADLISAIEEKGARFLTIDPQTEGRSAERIADVCDLETVIIDPLGSDYRNFSDYYTVTWEKLSEAYDSN